MSVTYRRSLADIPIVESKHCLVSRWVFPRHRFIEFGPEDEKWARAAGYGHEVTEPGAFQVGNVLYAHPTVIEAIQRRLS